MAEILDITPAEFLVIGNEKFYNELAGEMCDKSNKKNIALLLEVNFPQVKALFNKDIISKDLREIVIDRVSLQWHKDNEIEQMQLHFSFKEKMLSDSYWMDRTEFLDLSKITFNVTVPDTIGIGICCEDTTTVHLIFKQSSYYADLCSEVAKIINSLNDFLPGEKQFRMEGYKNFIAA